MKWRSNLHQILHRHEEKMMHGVHQISRIGVGYDNYSPSYFYMPYSLTQDGINPHGFSGAPVFVNKEPAPDGVWSVSPHMVGIVQRFSRKKGILIVRKISTLIDLLNTDGGEA